MRGGFFTSPYYRLTAIDFRFPTPPLILLYIHFIRAIVLVTFYYRVQ